VNKYYVVVALKVSECDRMLL